MPILPAPPVTLLDEVTDNVTNGTAFDISLPEARNRDDRYGIYCFCASFEDGVAKCQVTPDGTNWFTARHPSGALATWDDDTGSGYLLIEARALQIRGYLSGITAAPIGALTMALV